MTRSVRLQRVSGQGTARSIPRAWAQVRRSRSITPTPTTAATPRSISRRPVALGAWRLALSCGLWPRWPCASASSPSRIPAPRRPLAPTERPDVPDERPDLGRGQRRPEGRHARAPVHYGPAGRDRIEERVVRSRRHRLARSVHRRLHRQVGGVRPIAATCRAMARCAPLRVEHRAVDGGSRRRWRRRHRTLPTLPTPHLTHQVSRNQGASRFRHQRSRHDRSAERRAADPQSSPRRTRPNGAAGPSSGPARSYPLRH